MAHVIYYRRSLMDDDELKAAQKHFKCVSLLSDIEKDDTVVYRYSLYPFPYDQEREILNVGAKPINTYNMHLYAADLQNYVADLKELTPTTWESVHAIPYDGPFVLKGETNSKKNEWSRSMFAEDKNEAIKIYGRLCSDGLISQQKIYVRQYVPLHTYLIGLGGMPITKEFRFFVAFGEVISGAYYWQNYVEDLGFTPDVSEVPKDFLDEVIKRIGNSINLVVIDVAQTANGGWTVIELNDLSQSGLSCNDPSVMYSNLKAAIMRNEMKHGI